MLKKVLRIISESVYGLIAVTAFLAVIVTVMWLLFDIFHLERMVGYLIKGYGSFTLILISYHFCKWYVTENKHKDLHDKWWVYSVIIGVVAGVALFVSVVLHENSKLDYNLALALFIGVVIPALFGASEGFNKPSRK